MAGRQTRQLRALGFVKGSCVGLWVRACMVVLALRDHFLHKGTLAFQKELA